jgi:chromosome segregation ATPase
MIGVELGNTYFVTNNVPNAQKSPQSLEGVHLAAVEELEALFDARLALEAHKAASAAAAADDTLFSAQEAARRQAAAHAAEVAGLHERHARAQAAAAAAAAAAQARAAETVTFWEEYAVQAESDYDEAEARINARLEAAAEAAGAREGLLRGELTILKRASLRLKGEKALDAKRLDKLLRDNEKLAAELDESHTTCAKLRRELEEREKILADNFSVIQDLRHRVQELEKHKYVLGYKAESYLGELEPRRAEVRLLDGDVVIV